MQSKADTLERMEGEKLVLLQRDHRVETLNAELLGNPGTSMIGNVIQRQFLVVRDYPTAAALSFMLMVLILAGVALYARLLGTEELTSTAI